MQMFRGKIFNEEVFEKYMKTLPSTKENSLINNALFTNVSNYKSKMSEQAGGYFVVEPLKGRIGGSYVNYDGNTDITSNERETYYQTKICFGRANAWGEYDFPSEITGENFMAEASEVKEYWDEVKQETVLAILKGIFSMNGSNNFATKHTYDITSNDTKTLGAADCNKAAQKALGDKKAKLDVLYTHSVVSTNLENLNLIEFLKYTDKAGITRDLTIGTWNGRTVIVDDEMPTSESVTTEPVYSTTVTTAATAGDKITIAGEEFTFVANDTESPSATEIKVGASGTAAQQATNIAAKLNAQSSGLKDAFTIAASSSKVTFTGKDDTAPAQPTIVATKVASTGTLVITNAIDTPAVVVTNYVTYMFKNGFFEFEDLGVVKPSELDRDAKTKGGHTDLVSRVRYMIVPTLISYIDQSKVSPEKSDFENGDNWELANNNKSGANRKYVDDKLIPIVKIVSRG